MNKRRLVTIACWLLVSLGGLQGCKSDDVSDNNSDSNDDSSVNVDDSAAEHQHWSLQC